ncbi:MAG: FHA domain-containing protein, partial [Planctomycetes bacterium]|nr:FHA domain-containing protein [Planctomycetota bacterium]
ILTDLESTNGTRVNGRVIQICRLQAGDRISLGRSMLLFGSNEEILARMADLGGLPPAAEPGKNSASRTEGSATIRAANLTMPLEQDSPFDLNPGDDITIANGNFFVGTRPLPPLPQKLSPSQAARLAEILDFLHRGLTNATENIRTAEDTSEVQLVFADWQKILGVHMLLGRYLRAISEPESLED